MSNRAVTYARVSGDDRVKDGRNLAGQLDICREHALKKGYFIVAELSEDDRGASGASFELPALNQALEMAKNSEFDVLVVREIDRFARSLAKQLIIEQEFRRHRVQIEYVMGEYPDTPEGGLNKNIKAVIAEYERLKINERMVRGRRQKVKAGNVVIHGKPPYGYRLEEIDGKSTLVVNEDEAQIVNLIYHWYVYGEDKKGPMSARVIARRLTQMGVPIPPLSTRSSPKWSRTTVGRIVSSKTYIGVWYYGKNGSLNGRRIYNPEDHWLAVEVPAIVDMGLWDAAQERKAINIASAKKNLKYQYLMNRRLICGTCGSKIAACGTNDGYKNRLYYRCNVARGYDEYERKCDNARYFKAEDVDFTIWEWLKSFIRNPDAIDAGIAEYHENREREQAPIRERLQVVDDLLNDHRSQLQKILDLYLDGNFPKELLVERRQRLQETIDSLANERVNLTSHLESSAYSPEQLQAMKEYTHEIAAGLDEAEEDFDSRKHIVEMLNVFASLVVEGDEKVAYVTCVFKTDPERLLIVSPNINFSVHTRGFCLASAICLKISSHIKSDLQRISCLVNLKQAPRITKVSPVSSACSNTLNGLVKSSAGITPKVCRRTVIPSLASPTPAAWTSAWQPLLPHWRYFAAKSRSSLQRKTSTFGTATTTPSTSPSGWGWRTKAAWCVLAQRITTHWMRSQDLAMY
jgi:site-specific DNA recombinase